MHIEFALPAPHLDSPALPVPSFKRRLASLVYELLLLAALLFIAAFLVVGLLPAAPAGLGRLVFQLYLLTVCGVYFVWFWRHGGQTLAMKTWGIRLVDADGGPIGLCRAWLRYGWAIFGTALGGAGFLWALWDADGQFLHDRLAGTRLVMSDPPQAPAKVSGPPPARGRPASPG